MAVPWMFLLAQCSLHLRNFSSSDKYFRRGKGRDMDMIVLK